MRTVVRLLLALVLVSLALSAARADEPAAKGKTRVLLTFGGHDFEEKPFFAMFDALPITYTKAPMPKSGALLKPGLEKDFDVLVMYDMVGRITPEQQKTFVELLKQGIGVVALHHNMGAHPDWPEYTKIIGGKFCTKPTKIGDKQFGVSGWDHDQTMKITVADKEHPITRGLSDFTIHDEVYNKYYVLPSVKVLLTTDHPKNDRDIGWVQEYGKSRVFYFMLGHDSKAWAHPNYKEILARGIRWAAGK
jgi:type 1 glutamine amidotransferase